MENKIEFTLLVALIKKIKENWFAGDLKRFNPSMVCQGNLWEMKVKSRKNERKYNFVFV